MGSLVSTLINFPGCCQSDSAHRDSVTDIAGEPPLSSNDKLNIAADSAAEFLNPEEVQEEGSGVLTIIVKEEAVPKPSTLSTESASLQGQLDLDNSRGQLGEIEPPSYVGLQAQEQTDQNELYQEIAEETPAQAAWSLLESDTVNTVKRQLQEIEASNTSLFIQMQTLSAENSNLQQKLQGKVQLQTQLQTTEAERLALLGSVVALMAEKTEQKKLREEITEKMSAQADELSSSRTESKTFQDQLGETNTIKEQLQTQLQTIEAERLALLGSVVALMAEKTEQKKLREETTEKMATQADELPPLRTESKIFQDQLGEANTIKKQLQNQVEEKEAENLRLLEAVGELNREKAELQAQLREKDEENAFEVSTLQQKLTAAETALQTVAADKEKLEGSSPIKNYYQLKEAHQKQTFKVHDLERDNKVKADQLKDPVVRSILGI